MHISLPPLTLTRRLLLSKLPGGVWVGCAEKGVNDAIQAFLSRSRVPPPPIANVLKEERFGSEGVGGWGRISVFVSFKRLADDRKIRGIFFAPDRLLCARVFFGFFSASNVLSVCFQGKLFQQHNKSNRCVYTHTRVHTHTCTHTDGRT